MNYKQTDKDKRERVAPAESTNAARLSPKRIVGGDSKIGRETTTSSSVVRSEIDEMGTKIASLSEAKTTSTAKKHLKKAATAFRMTNRNQQSHRQPLYCIAWSTDIHVDENGKLFQYVATCGARQLTIYEMECNNAKGTFEAKQFYKDEDKAEHFYACAYGGRSKYWASVRLDNNDENSQSEEEDDAPSGTNTLHETVDLDYNAGVTTRRGREKSSDNLTNESKDQDKDNETEINKESSDDLPSNSGRKRRRREIAETLILESEVQGKSGYIGIEAKKYSSRGPQLICVAGAGAVIKVIDPVQKRQLHKFQGHGSDIYDLKMSPTNEFLLLSASVDESVRLWNLQSFSCVAIFAGHHGHRESVLSISWHPLGTKFASSGMDKSIRLWNVDGARVSEALQASQTSECAGESRPAFHPVCAQFPYFATTKVHLNFVDCVHFVGDLLLSKSTYNTIVLWMPKLTATSNSSKTASVAYNPPSDVIALRTFELDNCNIWFVRFATDCMGRLLAVGNIKGEIDIWDIDSCKKHPSIRLKAVNCSTIRTLSFSPDGRTLIACNDQASVFKWDAC